MNPRRVMGKHGNVKNDRKYEALRRKGMSKKRAAKITNAGTKASKKGGRKAAAKRRKSTSRSRKR